MHNAMIHSYTPTYILRPLHGYTLYMLCKYKIGGHSLRARDPSSPEVKPLVLACLERDALSFVVGLGRGVRGPGKVCGAESGGKRRWSIPPPTTMVEGVDEKGREAEGRQGRRGRMAQD